MIKQRGFTLIEIAIVLVIIGLLTGGVLKGQALIQNAKVRNTISQMDELKASVFGFQDRYRALPGDMSKASQIIGSTATNCKTACDNGLIQPWQNTSLVTNHLAAAGFYSGPTNSAEVNKAPTAQNAPTNPWGGALFVAYWNQFNVKDAASKTSKNGIYTGNAIPANVLAEIDRKIDDGSPQTGSFRSAYPKLATANCITKGNWEVSNPSSDCAGVSLY